MKIKILLGGSPCTHWSIAKHDREIKPNGIGWELFKNYLIAKEKFKPDLFLYENNKSAAQPIKDQIARELYVNLMYINSALVSAQNRQRFYAFNWNVKQPEDRKLLLKDVLEHKYIEHAKPLESIFMADASTPITPICVNSKSGRNGIVGLQPSLADRIYDISGKATAVTTAFMPKVAIPFETCRDGKNNCFIENTEFEGYPIYTVKSGEIVIHGKKSKIKLADGKYIIRKLTPIECERLQTLPDNYTACVSNTQRYKTLGNGWTAEVIVHILNGALKDVPKDTPLQVLSMYDGIATGRYCLDKMGFTNVEYHAYEIDKYAIQIAMSNYPDIVQHGDAFQVRQGDWKL